MPQAVPLLNIRDIESDYRTESLFARDCRAHSLLFGELPFEKSPDTIERFF
jgi:hypothetical protein